MQPTANFAHCNGQQKHTTVPVFELLCHSIFKFQPSWLPRFLELAQQQSGGSSKSSWGYSMKESSESLPLYKRALTVLPCKGTYQHLEVELLLCSERPKAIMQALRILIKQGQWERVAQVAERFCRWARFWTKRFSVLCCAKCPNIETWILIWTCYGLFVQRTWPWQAYLILYWKTCLIRHRTLDLSRLMAAKSPSAFWNRCSESLQRKTKPGQRYADILQSPTVLRSRSLLHVNRRDFLEIQSSRKPSRGLPLDLKWLLKPSWSDFPTLKSCLILSIDGFKGVLELQVNSKWIVIYSFLMSPNINVWLMTFFCGSTWE